MALRRCHDFKRGRGGAGGGYSCILGLVRSSPTLRGKTQFWKFCAVRQFQWKKNVFLGSFHTWIHWRFLCGSDSQLQCDIGTKEGKKERKKQNNWDDPDEVVSGEVVSLEVMKTKPSNRRRCQPGLRTIREPEEKRSGFPSSLIHVVPSELHYYSRDCL